MKNEEVDKSDIEKQIKEIQLQREQLALERELYVSKLGRKVGSVAASVATPIKRVRESFFVLSKIIPLLIVVIIIVVTAVNYEEDRLKEEYNLKRKMWDEGRNEFAKRECNISKACNSSNFVFCETISSDIRFTPDEFDCQMKASKRYERDNPRPSGHY